MRVVEGGKDLDLEIEIGREVQVDIEEMIRIDNQLLAAGVTTEVIQEEEVEVELQMQEMNLDLILPQKNMK